MDRVQKEARRTGLVSNWITGGDIDFSLLSLYRAVSPHSNPYLFLLRSSSSYCLLVREPLTGPSYRVQAVRVSSLTPVAFADLCLAIKYHKKRPLLSWSLTESQVNSRLLLGLNASRKGMNYGPRGYRRVIYNLDTIDMRSQVSYFIWWALELWSCSSALYHSDIHIHSHIYWWWKLLSQ